MFGEVLNTPLKLNKAFKIVKNLNKFHQGSKKLFEAAQQYFELHKLFWELSGFY